MAGKPSLFLGSTRSTSAFALVMVELHLQGLLSVRFFLQPGDGHPEIAAASGAYSNSRNRAEPLADSKVSSRFKRFSFDRFVWNFQDGTSLHSQYQRLGR